MEWTWIKEKKKPQQNQTNTTNKQKITTGFNFVDSIC